MIKTIKSKYDFLTKDILEKDYCELKSLSAIGRKYNIPTGTIKSRARRLNVVVDNPGGKNIYSVNENIFSDQNEKAFYIAGFAAADGNVGYYSTGIPKVFRIGLSRKDKAHLETIKNAMDFTGKIYDTKQYDERYERYYYASTFNIYCSKKIIIDIGTNFNVVPNKTLIYQFPTHLIDHKLINHFIRGYNDGDGCWTKYKQFRFELLGTYDFLKTCENILKEQCELKSKAVVLPHKKIFRLRFAGDYSVSRIAKFLYQDANLYLPRKYELIKHLI